MALMHVDKSQKVSFSKKDPVVSSQSRTRMSEAQQKLQDEQLRIEEDNALRSLPVNGCSCSGDRASQSKTGCINAEKWFKLSFKNQEWIHFNNYKLYQMHVKSQQMILADGGVLMGGDNQQSAADNEQDIMLDVDRTFQHLEYFQRPEIKESMKRILVTYSNYEASIGYV